MTTAAEPHAEPGPFALGYEHEAWKSGYYTARVMPGVGVCICKMLGCWMVQFFPWNEEYYAGGGQGRYVNFITNKAQNLIQAGENPFEKWPYLNVEEDNTLVLKCIVEDCIAKIGEINANHQRSTSDAAAGKAVE